jgi:hypothetical protein
MEKGTTTFVGLDAHMESISVAMLLPGEGQEVECSARTIARRCDRW